MTLVKVMISCLYSSGRLLRVNDLWMMLTRSYMGMLVYMFLMSNEHILTLGRTLF
jgi:hypothetical protein